MEAQAEKLAQRVQAARVARLQVQRMRCLAAERVEKLERKLKHAAESGLRSEISRSVEVRSHLRAAGSRNLTARYSAIAAFGLLLGVAALGLGWTPLQDAAATGQPASQAPVLVTAPGDRLALVLTYSVSPPAGR